MPPRAVEYTETHGSETRQHCPKMTNIRSREQQQRSTQWRRRCEGEVYSFVQLCSFGVFTWGIRVYVLVRGVGVERREREEICVL